MPIWELIFLGLAAFLGGIISGVSGMGGGIFLFSLMTFTTPLATIIPTHGVVQFFSNLSRIFLLKKNIVLRMVIAFSLGLPFGVWLAISLIKKFFHSDSLLLIIALMILMSVFKPKRFKTPLIQGPGFILIGFISGILGIIIGTVGPFIALFFLRDDLKKEQIVATKAVVQFLVHMTKIPTYIYLGFTFKEYSLPMLIMVITAILGTQLGVRILHLISEQTFRLIFKGVLLISAARLIAKGLGF